MTNTDEKLAVSTLIADGIRDLIKVHYDGIRDLHDEDEPKSRVPVSVSIELNFHGKTPAGAVNISYAKRVKDGSTFRVDDAEQEKLPI